MYIDKVSLTNIRGFSKLEFSLARKDETHAGWTVFTGDNGSGKSTLLKAIAIALTGRDTARALQPSFDGWIKDDHTSSGTIEISILHEDGVDEFSPSGRTPQRAFQAKVTLVRGEKNTFLEGVGAGASSSKKSAAQRGPWSTTARGWFSCGYGPFRRVFGASPEATRLMVSPATERFVTMFQEAASLFEVDQWLRSLSHKKLEGKTEEGEQLDLLVELLRDDLLPNDITVDHVDSDGLWLQDRNKLNLSWAEMSDGYRAALALLTDIVRHLITVYGVNGLLARDENNKLYVARPGIVMIDEIDAHLHPEWQQKIGFWLKKHFPKIQFLVTTHSPLICQAADDNGLFVLPEPGSGDEPRSLTNEEYNRVIASRPDTILLTPAFGLQNTRSPVAVASRAEYSKLRAKKRAGGELSTEESERLEQLKLFAEVAEEI